MRDMKKKHLTINKFYYVVKQKAQNYIGTIYGAGVISSIPIYLSYNFLTDPKYPESVSGIVMVSTAGVVAGILTALSYKKERKEKLEKENKWKEDMR